MIHVPAKVVVSISIVMEGMYKQDKLTSQFPCHE